MRVLRLTVVVAVLVVAGVPAAAAIQCEPKDSGAEHTLPKPHPDWVLVFDLTAPDPAVYSFAASTTLSNKDPKATGVTQSASGRSAVFARDPLVCWLEFLIGNKSDLASRRKTLRDAISRDDPSTTRWISDKGDIVWMYIIYKPKEMAPKIEGPTEAKRDRRIVSQMDTLTDIVAKIAGLTEDESEAMAEAAKIGEYGIQKKAHRLGRLRATLSASVGFYEEAEATRTGRTDRATRLRERLIAVQEELSNLAVPTTPSERATAQDLAKTAVALRDEQSAVSQGGARSEKSASIEIITGPAEHWFLSADIAINDVEQLKFDTDTGMLSERGEPSPVYLGINYQLGDIHTKGKLFWKNFVLKGMIEASSTPSESLGAAIGYRGFTRKKHGLDLTTFSPWIGYTFTKEDEMDSMGGFTRNTARNSEFRWGISVNLDKLFGWVKSRNDTGDTTDDDSEDSSE